MDPKAWRPGPKATHFPHASPPLRGHSPQWQEAGSEVPRPQAGLPLSQAGMATLKPTSPPPTVLFPSLFFASGNWVGTSLGRVVQPCLEPNTHSLKARAPQASARGGGRSRRPPAGPASHLLLALAAETQACGPFLVAVAVVGAGLVRLELHHPPGAGGGAVRVAGVEGGEPALAAARVRAPPTRPREAGRSLLSATRLRRRPATTASFLAAQAPHCRRLHGCRRRYRHGRAAALCHRHPRRRPRRHLGRAASAA